MPRSPVTPLDLQFPDAGSLAAANEAVADESTASARSQLCAVDDVLGEYHLERRIVTEHQERTAAERDRFARAASHALRCVVKPALQAVADRLAEDGVGGLVQERPPSARVDLRLVLWMSLDGPIVAAPRQDRNPYLQLDVDVDHREVRVWEGDMWLHLGASRPAAPLALHELTAAVATDRAVAVLRRAASHSTRILAGLLPQSDLP